MKRKLLFALISLIAGGGNLWAQTDVTSTYLTNADFEGSYSSYSKPSGDRDIYQPEGWGISYTNGNENDLTSLSSSTTQWSQFSGKPQPANGGTNTYWMRFRWGGSENITLSQETSANLPAGTYAVTVDAYSDDNTGTATISAAGVTQTVRTDGVWATHTVVFTLVSAQKVTVSLSYTNTAADDHAAAFDNVKILDLNSEPSGIALRNELGGTAADLADFNVWYDDYTLEVAGTAGTAISVAADNISYTPEATGTVRFVKKDGIVYVFEGTSYKTAVHSSKAAYAYARTLTKDDPTTDNYLENPSFETTGDFITGKKYKIGSPWSTNYSGSDIRIDKGTKSGIHGECVLVWRGSGSGKDWYFTQQVTTLPKYKGVKVYLQQIDAGNANAKFNIGLGNAAGDYSYLSTQVTLGTSQNGVKNAVLGYNEDMATGDVYFTFRNTSTNTASSGSDPVSQIDWIGLVGSDDFPISGVSSAAYVYGTAYAPATAKSSYLAAKAEAEATIADATYDNVTGEERTNLQAAIDAVVEDNDEAYNTATGNIQDAASAFTDALSHYQALIDAQAAVPDLAYASTSASAFKTAVATSASDADAKVASMTTDIRAYYESHALAEGVDGAVDKTSLLTNYNNPSNTSGWTITNTVGNSNMRTMSNESYTDSDGTNNHSYFDSNSWGTAFSTTFTQNVELAAGTYILTAKARGNGTTTYQITADGETTDISSIGNTGGVFGRGWNDNTVEFTLAAKKTVTLGINMVTGNSGNWLSFGNFRLVRIAFTAATTADYDALNAAISTAEAHTLGFEDGEYAPYNNVDALTALANAKAVNQSVENAKSDVEALTTALSGASWTANSGDVDAIYNGMFATVAEGQNYPDGWTRTNGWGNMQSGIEGDFATAYYNQPGSLQYGNQGVYTMPLAASQLYKLTFSYRSHENNSNNGVTVSVKNGDDGMSDFKFPGNGSTSVWKTVSAYFTTGAAGDYVLTLANDGNTWMTNVSLVKADASELTISSGKPANDTFFQNLTLGGRTFSHDNWNTLCVPFAFDKDNFAEVKELSSITVTGNHVGMTLSDAETIVAGMPYLVKAKNNGDALTATNVLVGANVQESSATADGYTVNYVGTYDGVALTDANSNAFVVSNSQLWNVNSDVTVGAYRAYFTVATANEVKALFFNFDDTDAIRSIADSQEPTADGQIFNLAGQRLSKMQKGINIVNGKKVLVK